MIPWLYYYFAYKVLHHFEKFTRKHVCWSLFLMKLQASSKILRTLFLQNNSRATLSVVRVRKKLDVLLKFDQIKIFKEFWRNFEKTFYLSRLSWYIGCRLVNNLYVVIVICSAKHSYPKSFLIMMSSFPDAL